MSHSNLRKVEIDRFSFQSAFARDAIFEDTYPQYAYLDLETGETIWVYENDEHAEDEANIPAEENAALRERVEAEPGRFLEVPGLDHGDHHDVLRKFLKSKWTDDEERWSHAWDAYSGSIGRWKRAVGDEEIVHAYHAFCERRMQELAEEFLRENGIEPVWR